MTINGKKVEFKCKHVETHYDMYDGGWAEVTQRWEIPALGLYGFIDPRDSLAEIKHAIEKEVAHDLAQREKRTHGIQA